MVNARRSPSPFAQAEMPICTFSTSLRPSDANARMEAAEAIEERWRPTKSRPSSSTTSISSTSFRVLLLVFEGEGGVEGRATGPYNLREMNRFLAGVDVVPATTTSRRPRINKNESRKDREQRSSGDYYSYGAVFATTFRWGVISCQ